MEPDKIGKFIANLRKEKNLNQQELANELYVSTKTISKWETGRGIPDLASLRKICEYFNITLEELLNGKLNEKNTSKTFKYVENYKKKFILRLIINTFMNLKIFTYQKIDFETQFHSFFRRGDIFFWQNNAFLMLFIIIKCW